MMAYTPAPNRYDRMVYRRTGRSGLMLPALTLGLWHNFGHDKTYDNARMSCSLRSLKRLRVASPGIISPSGLE